MRRTRKKAKSGKRFVYMTEGGRYFVNMERYGKPVSRTVDSVEEAVEIRDRYARELEQSGYGIGPIREATFMRWGDVRRDGRRAWPSEEEIAEVEAEIAEWAWWESMDGIPSYENYDYEGCFNPLTKG